MNYHELFLKMALYNEVFVSTFLMNITVSNSVSRQTTQPNKNHKRLFFKGTLNNHIDTFSDKLKPLHMKWPGHGCKEKT